jgi:GNAT superfamily N-acetyltransferase
MLTYRKMTLTECDKINEMDAAQYIGRAWREVEGARKLIDIDYLDPTWPNGYDVHYNNLKSTISSEGEAVGAYDEADRLKGFVTVNRMTFGKSESYALLDQLFVSLESRGQGIGKRLFLAAVEIAKRFDVGYLFICAGSAEETIAFYRSLGCIDAPERHNDYYESDPRDLQMVYSVNS